MMKRHWLAPRKDGSWDVIDSEAVADAYRNEGRVKVEGPFVPAEQLEGAVGLREASRRSPGALRATRPDPQLHAGRVVRLAQARDG
jgi:hypothetical protein